MSFTNKVVWTEGMFLRPQHFQQQDRHVERLVRASLLSLQPLRWGFKSVEIDQELLETGKVAIVSASGVLPDGTPFDIPQDAPPPAPLVPSESVRDGIVHLTLPTRHRGTLDVAADAGPASLARYEPIETELRDVTAEDGLDARIQVGHLRFRLAVDKAEMTDRQTLGVCKIRQVGANRDVSLDKDYIPPLLDCRGHPALGGFIDELQGMLHQRAETLAGRVSTAGSGTAEIADFLLLLAVNRYEPVIAHLAKMEDIHPLRLFEILVSIAGELSTFTAQNRRPPEMPTYQQDDLQATFKPVFDAIRRALSAVMESAAIEIPLDPPNRYGIYRGTIFDRNLISNANFVLAVRADLPAETLRQTFPGQTKVGPVEKISDLVNRALPGIQLKPLPVAPRQIPFHSGSVYFQLDASSSLWKDLQRSAAFAFHVAGQYPNISLDFWAIRH